MCICMCTIYSYVHLCVDHLFPCASMCAPFIPMRIYVCTIYSHVHLCLHHLFPCASMCAPFIPMYIYVCTIYSHVQHLFPCAPFISKLHIDSHCRKTYRTTLHDQGNGYANVNLCVHHLFLRSLCTSVNIYMQTILSK